MRKGLRTEVLGEKSVCVCFCVWHFVQQKSCLNLNGGEESGPPFFDTTATKHATHVTVRKRLFYDEKSKTSNNNNLVTWL
jgi:hypothetical protein